MVHQIHGDAALSGDGMKLIGRSCVCNLKTFGEQAAHLAKLHANPRPKFLR